MLQQQLNIRILAKPCKVTFAFTALFAFATVQILLMSCSTKVEFEWSDKSQKYVLNCFTESGKPIKIFAFTTTSIFDGATNLADGLDVEIYKNGVLAWAGGGKEAGEYPTPVYAKAGAIYRIKMQDKNGLSFSAEDTIPEFVRIQSASYLFPVYTDIYDTKFGKVSLSFQDDGECNNFYEIVILDKDSSVNQTFNINSRVITLNNENDPNAPGTILFTDELFNGQKLDLNIFVNSFDPPLVVLKNISRNYYEYRKSINTHFYNQNSERYDVYSMFKGDPVELYSNVNNGIGIFAGCTLDIKECTRLNQ